jgi:predicted DNA-binding antitoxin AbrB/MazE fold protein
MGETIPAVFENGVFRPLRRPRGLVEHHHVRLTVDVEARHPSRSGISTRSGRLMARR